MRFLIPPLLLMLVLMSSCKTTSTKEGDIRIDIITPQQYIVCKTQTPLKIDGIADEEAWEAVPFTNSFIDIEGVKTPKYDTKIKMLWDEQFFYVYAQLMEPHIWANLYQRDTVIFYNNDFEVFLDPSMDTYNYGEIEINAINTVWDLNLDKPYRVNGNADNSWNLDSIKTAIQIYGTLNNPNDIDSCWTVEMAIPIDRMMELKYAKEKFPADGEQWKVNFSRVEWDFDLTDGKYDRKKVDGKYLPEYNWVWSNQGVINMHEPEKWGIVQFTNNATHNDIIVTTDIDFTYKQTAYALFRKTQFGDLKYLLEKETGFTESYKIIANSTPVNAVYTKTQEGFQYELSGNNKTFTIDQIGYINIK